MNRKKNMLCEVVNKSRKRTVCHLLALPDIGGGLLGRMLMNLALFEHWLTLCITTVYICLLVLTANFFFSSRFYLCFSARSIIRHICSVLRSSLDIAALFCSTLILLDLVMGSVRRRVWYSRKFTSVAT